MSTQMSREGLVWSRKAKALAAGALMAAMMAVSPAHASTTFVVNIPGDVRDANTGDNRCDVNVSGTGDQCVEGGHRAGQQDPRGRCRHLQHPRNMGSTPSTWAPTTSDRYRLSPSRRA